MDRVKAFITDLWGYSAPRIRRADPLLMGAAIAYNSLFALVPLAIAFVSILSFVDTSGDALQEVIMRIQEVFPPDVAEFLTDILSQSTQWVEGDRTIVLVVSLLIALWSGSRAVYAVQKALRTVQATEDERGYIVSRLLGIGVTVAAGVAVLVAYAGVLIGTQLWDSVVEQFGIGTANTARVAVIGVAIVWGWLLLWAIYRWGPPQPMPLPGVTAASVAALIVLGSLIALELAPTGGAVVAVFGAFGVFLIWLYYVGIVIVAAPTAFAGVATALKGQLRR